MAEECVMTNVLCSLDELNDYSCSNISTIASPCTPLCSQGGISSNTSWWGFVTWGGNVCIILTVGGCTIAQGLQFGIWGDCDCGEEIACRSIPCVPRSGVEVMCATLQPCKTYYLWVDGCSGDICDFTLNTSGGGPPTLSPLGFINNIASRIIQPVCVGACNVRFFVNDQPGGCEPTYVWTLDGDEVGGNDNEVRLDFPDEGDFEICVTAYIGNPQSGSICSQEGPQCATIKVRPIPDKLGIPRVLCWEQANPGGYKWHTQRITTSGTYREQFTDPACCKFDSVVDFTVLNKPLPVSIYYITCDSTPYLDIKGLKHFPCKDQFEIVIPKSTDIYHCDSTILLTAINVNFETHWQIECIGGKIILAPNIKINKPCNLGEVYKFEYIWYKKNDPAKQVISNEERLSVGNVDEEYCLVVNVRVDLNNVFNICSKEFCETFSEHDFALNRIPVTGNVIYCFEEPGIYKMDTNINELKNFNWSVTGGVIASPADTQVITVNWLLNPNDTGKVCLAFETDCGKSVKCISVIPVKNFAGKDFKKRGLETNLNAMPDRNGRWRLINGPSAVFFQDTNNSNTKISVQKYGLYCFEWALVDSICKIKDTVCVEFYKFKVSIPDTPKRWFEDRTISYGEKSFDTYRLFTPNLISSSGNSFFSLDDLVADPCVVRYCWLDIYGRVVISGFAQIVPNSFKVQIESPKQAGIFLFMFELKDQMIIKKVCVYH